MENKLAILICIMSLILSGCGSTNTIVYNGEDNTLHLFEDKSVRDKSDNVTEGAEDDELDYHEGYTAMYYKGKGLNETIEINGIKYTVTKTEISKKYLKDGMIEYEKNHEGEFKVKNNEIEDGFWILYVTVEMENTTNESKIQYCCNSFLDDQSTEYGNSYDSLLGEGKSARFYEIKAKEKVELVQGNIFTEDELKKLNLYLLFEGPEVSGKEYDIYASPEAIKVYEAGTFEK